MNIRIKKFFACIGILLVIMMITTDFLPVNAAVSSNQTYKDEITVATVNFPSCWGDKSANIQTMERYIAEAAKNDVDMVLFPEQALTGYDSGGDEKMHKLNAETIPGPTTEKIAKLANKYNMWIIFGMPEIDPATSLVYNSVAIVGPDGSTISYRKINTALDEPLWCEHGNEPVVFDTEWGPVGIGICYDSYAFPGIARYAASKGARLYLNSTAAGVPDMGPLNDIIFSLFRPIYLNMLKARAAESSVFVVSSNLVGKDLHTDFMGESVILGPDYPSRSIKIYAGPAGHTEGMVVAKIDLSRTENMRR